MLVMSATIDGARFARLLGEDAPIIESEGRSYPLEIRWLGGDASNANRRPHGGRGYDRLARQGRRYPRLPTRCAREIERVRERLAARLPEVPIHALHGQIEPAAQRAAIRRDAEGRRRIVLATAIAETSLTLDGVSVVVDSGLARLCRIRPRGGHHASCHPPRLAGLGGAARRARGAAGAGGWPTGLWEEAGHAGRPEFAAARDCSGRSYPAAAAAGQMGGRPIRLHLRGSIRRPKLRWRRRAGAPAGNWLRWMRRGGLRCLAKRLPRYPWRPISATAVLHRWRGLACAEDTARLVMLLQGTRAGRARRRPRAAACAVAREGSCAEGGGGPEDRAGLGRSRRASSPRLSVPVPPPAPRGAGAGAGPISSRGRRDVSGPEHWLSAAGRGYVLDPASSAGAG